MAKRRSKTANILLKNNKPPITSKDEVNKTLAKIQGREGEIKEKPSSPIPIAPPPVATPAVTIQRTPAPTIPTQPSPTTPQYIQPRPANIPVPPSAPPKQKRLPLTTAITPENRALLEVASLHTDSSVADMLNAALEYYFTNLVIIQDRSQVEMFKQIYARKAK